MIEMIVMISVLVLLSGFAYIIYALNKIKPPTLHIRYTPGPNGTCVRNLEVK